MCCLKRVKEAWKKSCKGPKKSFEIYWECYGGFEALYRSIYLHISFLFSFVINTFGFIYNRVWDWAGNSLFILPNILGFTLGGYAILVGFGDKDFLNCIRGRHDNGNISPYMKANGAFVHFIIVQVSAIFFSLLCSEFGVNDVYIFRIIGSFLLLYALLSVVAAAFAILNFSNWYDKMPKNDDEG